ncbi:solute carrier family 22 member 15 [Echinococcus multilocularis]|uniref:Solute carrier family 22 member 15 n=1 Tax=Echinococcus multilocularis TaxID=6211 RepID=A0A0S4MJ11_ECHMU|nr:solute carrier family 22 member 15 [Echinococcus multilocularis]
MVVKGMVPVATFRKKGCRGRFSNAAAYYGSTIASGEAFANRFLSFALCGLIEIPGHCLSPQLIYTA